MSATTSTPARVQSVTPYLAVRNARRALDWYAEALDAEQAGEPVVMPDGRIGHSELRIGDSLVMMADEHPEIEVVGPESLGGTSVTLHAGCRRRRHRGSRGSRRRPAGAPGG